MKIISALVMLLQITSDESSARLALDEFANQSVCIEQTVPCFQAALDVLWMRVPDDYPIEIRREDVSRAVQILEWLCVDEVVNACTEFGFSASIGRGTRQDLEQGIALLERNCRGPDTYACVYLGAVFNGDIDTIPADFERSNRNYARACEANQAIGCLGLGDAHRNGRGVGVDFNLAISSYRRACELGEIGGCEAVGEIFYFEDDVYDPTQAVSSFQIGCQTGRAYSCGMLGYLLLLGRGIEQDLDAAEEYMRFACAQGHAASCANLGDQFSSGEFFPIDMELSTEFMGMACRLNEPLACNRLNEIGSD